MKYDRYPSPIEVKGFYAKIVLFVLALGVLISCSSGGARSNDMPTEMLPHFSEEGLTSFNLPNQQDQAFNSKKELVSNEYLSFNEELNFNTGFYSGNIQKEKVDNNEYLAIADYETHAEIVLFNPEADTVQTISLKAIKDLNERVLAHEIVSYDTVLVLSRHTNNLYFLNHEGKIWKHLYLGSNLGNDQYELSRISSPGFLLSNKKSAVFSLSYLGADLPPNYRFWDNPELFQSNKLNAPQLVYVKDIFADSLEYSFHLAGFQRQFLTENNYTAEGFGMHEVSNGFLYTSSFSDTVYYFNRDFQLQQKIQITSRYNKGYIEPPTLNEAKRNLEVLNERYANQGCIKRLVYMASKEVYLVVMAHDKLPDSPKRHSLIVMDANANLIGEIALPPDTHPNLLIFDDRIFIPNYQKHKGEADYFKKTTYDIYTFEINDL